MRLLILVVSLALAGCAGEPTNETNEDAPAGDIQTGDAQSVTDLPPAPADEMSADIGPEGASGSPASTDVASADASGADASGSTDSSQASSSPETPPEEPAEEGLLPIDPSETLTPLTTG